MKRLSKFLFYMLIGLLVAPLTSMAFDTPDILSSPRTTQVTVDRVDLIIKANPDITQQLQVGSGAHFVPPAAAGGVNYSYSNADNFAEFIVTGARGYWFNYSFVYGGVHKKTKVTLGGSTKGVTATFELDGSDETTYDGTYNSFYQVPDEGSDYTGAGTQTARLGLTTTPNGKFWLRVSITNIHLDKGLSSGIYQFPVTIIVGREPGY